MIKLKSKIVKSHVKDKARIVAKNIYKETWEPDYQILAFMSGVEYVINELRLNKK